MTRTLILTAVTALLAATMNCSGQIAAAQGAERPEILTPPPAPQPRINGAKVFGVRPGRPVLYTVAATGRRPMKFSSANLPEGLHLNQETGQLSGSLAGRETYRVLLRAENELGRAERELRIVVGDEILLTPLLGCNTWGGWGSRVTEANLRAAAKAMVKSGLIQHGWQYVNIDDGWQGQRGGRHNAIQPNEKFSDMKALCDYIHGLGLKAGIYSTPWTTSYSGLVGGSSDNPEGKWRPPKTGREGRRYGRCFFEAADSQQWAEWGFDYCKYDWGVDSVEVTRRMADALAACDRDIVMELSNSVPLAQAADYTRLAQLSRTTGDLVDFWDRSHMDPALGRWAVGIREVWLAHDAWAPHQRPGHWNHACNLRIGLLGGWRNQPLAPSHLTPDEQYTHISLWCLWGSPMIIGTPIERLDPFTLSLLSNDEVLQVNQDPLGKQGRRMKVGGGEAVVKELEDGSKAVGLFNPGAEPAKVSFDWTTLSLTGKQQVRDLWRQKDLGVYADRFTAEVRPHGVVLVRLAPSPESAPPAQAGASMGAKRFSCSLMLLLKLYDWGGTGCASAEAGPRSDVIGCSGRMGGLAPASALAQPVPPDGGLAPASALAQPVPPRPASTLAEPVAPRQESVPSQTGRQSPRSPFGASGQPFDLAKAMEEAAATPDARITRDGAAWRVHVGRSNDRPGIIFRPSAGAWDVTGLAYVEARVKNGGKGTLSVHLALDNPGANRAERKGCCIGSVTIPPGEAETLRVTISARPPKVLEAAFRGMRGTPGGFQTRPGQGIDPTNVVGISVYAYRPGSECEYEVSDVRAGGTPAFPLPKNLDDLFPMIDRFGQYIHKDWPGKTHSEDDLLEQRKQEALDLAAHPGPKDWNQYGGWLDGPKLEATGRFRVAKWRDKWWFVDPEGRLFWSHGLVRVTWSCGYTPVSGRERLFAELPARDSPFGPFYGRSTWAISGLYERGTQTYNFSGANLLRKYGPNWPGDFADAAHRRLRSWGLNTMANCSQPAIYLQRRTPYTATVYSLDSPPEDTPGATGYVATIHDDGRVIEGTSGGWGKFPDVFDPSFKATLVKEVAQHKGKAAGDPWCLGYFPGNELSWGADETALARAVLGSPADQPAKRALVDELKAKHHTIERLNAAWKTDYASWAALLESTTPPGAEQGRDDLAACLGRLAEAYFRQCREAVKEIDPEGLYLGCRFAGWSHGVVFRTAAKYSDVISVNRYTETLDDLRLPDGIDKPVLIGEWHFGALDRGKFHAGLRPVANQQARREAYEKYVASALANPWVVGAHWHQFGDQATTGRDDGENFQNGFVDVCDTPYAETVAACRRIGCRLYELRAGQED